MKQEEVNLPILKNKFEQAGLRVGIEKDNTSLMIYESMNLIHLYMDQENSIIYLNITEEC